MYGEDSFQFLLHDDLKLRVNQSHELDNSIQQMNTTLASINTDGERSVVYRTEDAYCYLAGRKKFKIEEIEIYKVE